MPSMHLATLPKWLLQSPPMEWAVMRLRSLLIGALRQGPIPKHIAFVMDGNRRFARNHGIETVEGHHLGFEALARILEVCYKSGVQVVTVYAFSIENFKRSKYEVDALMDLAKVKLAQLAQHGDLLERYSASVRVLGQRSLLKPDVLEAIDHAVEVTKNNGDAILNVCFPYTSQDEMTMAIRDTVAEYSEPIIPQPSPSHHHRHRSFSETHIAHNIQARRMSTSSPLPPSSTASTNSPQPTAPSPPPAQAVAQTGGIGRPSSSDQEPSSPPTLKVTRSHSPQSSSAAASDTEIDSISSTTTLYPETASPFPESDSHTMTSSTDPSTFSTSKQLPPPQTQSTLAPSIPHLPPDIQYPDPELITASTLTAHMFTANLPPLDLLIRTSGVERLSDFMLWQCHEDTEVVFLKCLWPEFDLWAFLPVLVEWQWRMRRRERVGGAFSGTAGTAVAAVDGKSRAEGGRAGAGGRKVKVG